MRPEEFEQKAERIVYHDDAGKEYICCGTPVQFLFPDIRDEELVAFHSRDGEIVAVSGEEIRNGGVFLVKEDSGYRLVIPNEVFHRRWCRQVVDITRE